MREQGRSGGCPPSATSLSLSVLPGNSGSRATFLGLGEGEDLEHFAIRVLQGKKFWCLALTRYCLLED